MFKMKPIFKSVLFVLSTIILTFSFLDEEKSLVKIFSDKYEENFNQLQTQLIVFKKATKSGDKIKVEKEYKNLRIAYKSLEPFLLYFDPDAVNKNLNGAPLLKLEENTPGINVLQPKGLQVMDELMGENLLNFKLLGKNVDELINKLKHLKVTLDPSSVTHRMVIELYQLNLIKLMTLEQSGFDTPGTLSGLEDSKVTFTTINQLIFPYLQQYSKLKKEVAALETIMKRGDELLENANDFNSFDRAEFLSKIVEPLFKQINIIHSKSGVEYYSEVSRLPRPYNEKAKNIFANNFLNPGFYSGVDPTQKDLIALGKTLFYDPVLSGNDKRACASCHAPEKGFTDGKETSIAYDFRGVLDRNAPTLLNSIFATDYFWDLRAQEIRNQIEHVVFNTKEFATGFNTIENKLRKSKEYQMLFDKSFSAYGGESINKNSIEVAITAYVQSLRGWNSQFDKYARGEENNLSENALQGFNLFMGKSTMWNLSFLTNFCRIGSSFFRRFRIGSFGDVARI